MKNKIVKYQFLYNIDVKNIEHLQSLLEDWIPIYNNQRPSISGNYLLTPKEVFEGVSIDTDSLKNDFSNAKKERILFNQTNKCEVC